MPSSSEIWGSKVVASRGVVRCSPGCAGPYTYRLHWFPSPCVCSQEYGVAPTPAAPGNGGDED